MVHSSKHKKRALRLVIKLGTSLLTRNSDRIDLSMMIEIVRQCNQLMRQGHQLIIVTSGAIAAGREALNYPELPKIMASKQLLAAVGQGELIQKWKQLFAIYQHQIGQILLTRADVEDKNRFLNAQDALNALIDQGIIPVINENDAVATTEIKVGDNDNLSAYSAILAQADQLILLTDQVGLFTADPRLDQNAVLIRTVAKIDDQIKKLAGDSISGLGTGGMSTKIEAAEIATKAGITVHIGKGDQADILLKIMQAQADCTTFLPAHSPLEHRKHWLLTAMPAGKLYLDDGAVAALKTKGSSLLPRGILSSAGSFDRGDVVEICDEAGKIIATGVSRYDHQAVAKISGHHSHEIHELIGGDYGFVVVHRDGLILK